MAESRVIERDLPDPGVLSRKSGQSIERQWRLWSVINATLLVYAIIHKLLVPIMRGSEIAAMDPWWIFHLLMIFPLRKKSTSYAAILSWVGLGFCLTRLALLRTLTWFSMSVTLTEGFSILFLILFLQSLVMRSEVRNLYRAAFLLPGIFLALLLPRFHPYSPMVETANLTAHQISTVAISQAQCGLKKMEPGVLKIESCGFATKAMKMSKDINVKNESGRFLNVRIERQEKGLSGAAWHFVRNIPVFTGKSAMIDSSVLALGFTYRIHSDSWPEAGVVIIE